MSAAKPIRLLDDCGCCDGLTASTPMRIDNRAGLDTISYRTGSYHQFRKSMLAGLSSSHLPALRGLTTRDSDDYSIALIDAWACVSDVLCFYQEYFANEGFLRTARERLSVLEHARLIGYQLNPGVAASAFLAFTMDEPAAGTVNPVVKTTIAAGSKVQSTPGPDETAQMYETLEEIQARVDWNAMRPRLTQPQLVSASMESVVISGITPFVKKGDELLIINGAVESVVKIRDVATDEENQTTQLQISSENVSPSSYAPPVLFEGDFADLDGFNLLDTTVVDVIISRSWKLEDIISIAETRHWNIDELMQLVNARSEKNLATQSNSSSVHGFRKRASLFGYNAQKRVSYTGDKPDDISLWVEWSRASDESQTGLFLDNAYEQVTAGSYLVLHYPELLVPEWIPSHGHYHYSVNPGSTMVYSASDVDVVARSAYGISSKTTRIELSGNLPGWNYSANMMTLVRQANVLVQSEALDLVQVPITSTVQGDRILLNHADFYLRNQQYVAVTGESADQTGVQYREVIQVKQVRLEGGFTELVFATSLKHQYIRDTVAINGNVAPAGHGESVSEILGDGDSGFESQCFTLKQTPLTYVSDDVPSGSVSSLEIRVDNVSWQEVDTFLGKGPEEKVFTTKLADDGAVQVCFGDGIAGSRLPSGTNNVVAYYRKGTGLDGMVGAQQLNMLLTRPLGVKDAVNPQPSEGADDHEKLEDARSNAPLGLLTLDRTVSLTDYEDFCRGFAGVAKARAVAVSRQGVPNIYITVAGPKGAVIDSSGDTYKKLLSALNGAGDPYTNFTILTYRPAFFKFDAGLYVAPEYQDDLVLGLARDAIRSTFDFNARAFNQPVHLSEVIMTLQGIEGVIAVDVNTLYRTDSAPVEPPPRSIRPVLASADGVPLGDELIMLDPAPMDKLRIKS